VERRPRQPSLITPSQAVNRPAAGDDHGQSGDDHRRGDQQVVPAARRLHTSGGGDGLLATIIHLYVLDGMRGRVFSGSGYPPDHGLTRPSLPKILRGTCR
jgi:hypothetical protein